VEYENRVLLGDCLEILRQLPSDTYNSCVTDPPYGLGNKEPTPAQLLAFFSGARLDTGGDFMGKKWEIPTVEVWREVYRVLKPGAHVISFGGTRTWDLISMGLRLAGFVKRDTIADNHPGLEWLQSQGMPKSHNVGKAIDKMKGATRTEVIGVKPGHEDFIGRGNNSSVVNLSESGVLAEGFSRPWMKDPEAVERYHTQYAPATEEAAEWEGWGSGLKPTWEPILVFRKPFKGTLAKNVLAHCTGAINIDACRVKHASKADFEQHKAQVEEVKRKGGVRDGSWKNSSDLSGASDVTEAGRFPPNVVMEHTPGCRKVGTKKVKASRAGTLTSTEKALGLINDDGWKPSPTTYQYPEDGQEEVEAWECIPGCPVAALDNQSGDRPSTLTGRATPGERHEHPGTETNPNSTFLGDRTYHSGVYADSGGISRVYPQFEQDEELKGRWPPNVILEHSPECQKVGTKKILGITGGKNPHAQPAPISQLGPSGPFKEKQNRPYKNHADEDGLEEVEDWKCVPGCPVAALAEQSGESKSAVRKVDKAEYLDPSREGWRFKRAEGGFCDSGTAARFYPQFEQELAEPFLYTGKATKKEATLDGEVENVHPTRKPVTLMRWLCRLVNRKGGLVLDPYCGSGSTLVAAEQEGMRWTGIENDPPMYETACQRAGLVREQLEEVRGDHATFDAFFGDDDD